MAGKSLRNFFDAFLAAVLLKICSEVVVGTMAQDLPKISYFLLTNDVVVFIGKHESGWRWFPVTVFIGETALIS